MVFTPFEIYWTFRDFWYERWKSVKSPDLISLKENLPINKKSKSKGISILMIKSQNSKKVNEIKTVLLLVHGFSDTKESLQHLYIPLARMGYIILAFDARGTGESKKEGKRGDFMSRIYDFKMIIDWIKSNPDFSNKRLITVGFSIGALTILSGGFSDERIEKIIAVSAISNYRKNLPKYNLIAMISYLLKGVNITPSNGLNQKMSPIYNIGQVKQNLPKKWELLSKRVFLIHSKNDKIIKFINFLENRQVLSLPDDNILIFSKGGHNLKKNELALYGKIMKILTN